jgi:hypothetical protein
MIIRVIQFRKENEHEEADQTPRIEENVRAWPTGEGDRKGSIPTPVVNDIGQWLFRRWPER